MPFKPAEVVQSAFETRSLASHGQGKVFWRLPAVGASETLQQRCGLDKHLHPAY